MVQSTFKNELFSLLLLQILTLKCPGKKRNNRQLKAQTKTWDFTRLFWVRRIKKNWRNLKICEGDVGVGGN